MSISHLPVIQLFTSPSSNTFLASMTALPTQCYELGHIKHRRILPLRRKAKQEELQYSFFTSLLSLCSRFQNCSQSRCLNLNKCLHHYRIPWNPLKTFFFFFLRNFSSFLFQFYSLPLITGSLNHSPQHTLLGKYWTMLLQNYSQFWPFLSYLCSDISWSILPSVEKTLQRCEKVWNL